MARALYRTGLVFYSRAFRCAHGEALVDTFDDQLDAAYRRRGLFGVWLTVVAEWSNAVSSALRARWGHSFPTLSALKHSGGQMVHSVMQDVRFALRTFVKHPAFVVSALVLLAVGIGVNTVIFSVVNAYLLRPLPFPASERLVSVAFLPPDSPANQWRVLPEGAFAVEWPNRDEVIEHLVAWDLDGFTLVGEQEPEAVPGAWVTPGYFAATGVVPQLGRVITDRDAQPDAPAVAVISHGLWQRRFGGDPDIVGRTIRAFSGDRPFDAEVFTVVGVLPEDFWFMNRFTELLVQIRGTRSPSLVVLQEGVTPDRAGVHLSGIVTGQVDGMPEGWRMHVEAAHERYVQDVRPILMVLLGAVGLVLLLACSNVAILLLVRAVGRERELTVRRALGADRGRLIRQLLTEGVVLAGAAGLVGVAFAALGLSALRPVIQEQLRVGVPGGVEQVALDPVVLAVAVGLSLVTGVVFALVPALSATGGNLTAALNEGGRGGADTRRRQTIRNALIAGEVAISVTLLIGAALMVRTAVNLQAVDLGFVADPVITAHIGLRERSYPEPEHRQTFVDRLESGATAVPGIEAAAVFAHWPFQDMGANPVFADGAGSPDAPAAEATQYRVGAAYFDVMRIPLLRGRVFDATDRRESEPVVIVGETLARRLWAGQDPIGRRVRVGADEAEPWRTVVGVVGDVRETLTEALVPDAFVPYRQSTHPHLFLWIAARVNGPVTSVIPELRRVVSEVDPTAALTRVSPMRELVARERARPRFLAQLLSGFGGLAVAIALFGLYSLVSYAVGQRRREVAVRMALGAAGSDVVGLFVRRGGVTIVVGVLVGVLGGVALSRGLTGQLFGVTAQDWVTYASVALALGTAAIVAVWVSARRAATTAPVEALRQE